VVAVNVPAPEELLTVTGSRTVTPAGMLDRLTRMRVAEFAWPGMGPPPWFSAPDQQRVQFQVAGMGNIVCDSLLKPD